jgi:hypothetical protein
MAIIRFYVIDKHEVYEWYRIWGSERRKKRGLIGTHSPSVEPPPIGNTMTLLVEPEFIEFLKTKNILFEVVSEAAA